MHHSNFHDLTIIMISVQDIWQQLIGDPLQMTGNMQISHVISQQIKTNKL